MQKKKTKDSPNISSTGELTEALQRLNDSVLSLSSTLLLMQKELDVQTESSLELDALDTLDEIIIPKTIH